MPTSLLAVDPGMLTAIVGFLGAAIGSFLNVVIHRLPKMMERSWLAECAEFKGETPAASARYDLIHPRSHCPACSRPVRAIENIPLLSYIALRGRCAGCGERISLRYPLVELVTALLSAFAAWRFGPTLATLGALILIWSLIALAFIDLDTQYLPDSITLPLLWAGLLFNLGDVFVPLSSAVSGAMLGYLLLWAVYWAFKLTTGKEGMGYGDFKLLAAIGAWLGWQMLPVTILLSSLVGAIVGLALIGLRRQGRETPIPFGPYLAAAGLIALFWGAPLTRSYLGLIR